MRAPGWFAVLAVAVVAAAIVPLALGMEDPAVSPPVESATVEAFDDSDAGMSEESGRGLADEAGSVSQESPVVDSSAGVGQESPVGTLSRSGGALRSEEPSTTPGQCDGSSQQEYRPDEEDLEAEMITMAAQSFASPRPATTQDQLRLVARAKELFSFGEEGEYHLSYSHKEEESTVGYLHYHTRQPSSLPSLKQLVDNLSPTPDAEQKRQVEAILKPMATFKVHVQPAPKHVVAVFQHILDRLQAGKWPAVNQVKIMTGKLSDRLDAINNELNPLPAVVVYVGEDGNDPIEAARAARQVVAELSTLFNGDGMDVTPRYNSRVNDAVFWAQDNGDTKLDMAQLVVFENAFCDDGYSTQTDARDLQETNNCVPNIESCKGFTGKGRHCEEGGDWLHDNNKGPFTKAMRDCAHDKCVMFAKAACNSPELEECRADLFACLSTLKFQKCVLRAMNKRYLPGVDPAFFSRCPMVAFEEASIRHYHALNCELRLAEATAVLGGPRPAVFGEAGQGQAVCDLTPTL